MNTKMWGGFFRKKTHPAFEYFSSSLGEDHKLAQYDLQATGVHCRMLVRIGLLNRSTGLKILKALDAIERDLDRHRLDFQARKFEDIHTFIEKELIRRVGPEARRIHAGRSRNDQVNQAMRMYCKASATGCIQLIENLQRSILKKARQTRSIIGAGFTHRQKAQPMILAHVFLSYIEALERIKEQLQEARARADCLTLGSGALGGTSIALDQEWMRRELKLARVSRNSLDAVGSRHFAAELVFSLALGGVELSRIAEDFLGAQPNGLGWFEIPEELSTGSSMMPQKKNPDFLELARGASAVLIGDAVSLLVLLKGLPSSYNRDLQWDKSPLFRSVEIMTQMLYLFEILFKGLRIHAQPVQESTQDDALYATDLAEHLVHQGMPFREAHEKVGRLIRICQDRKFTLREVPDRLLKDCFGNLGFSLRGVCDPFGSVSSKRTRGSTHPREIKRQIHYWEKRL